MEPTVVDGASETFQIAGMQRNDGFMASVRVKVIPTSALQYARSPCTFSPSVLGLQLGQIHFPGLRAVGPTDPPVLREIERKLATVRYINVALGRSPSSDCSSIQEVRWCLSQVTTSRAEHSPSVTTNGQLGIGTRDCIELRPSVDSFRVGRGVYFHRPCNTDRDFYHPCHHLVLH